MIGSVTYYVSCQIFFMSSNLGKKMFTLSTLSFVASKKRNFWVRFVNSLHFPNFDKKNLQSFCLFRIPSSWRLANAGREPRRILISSTQWTLIAWLAAFAMKKTLTSNGSGFSRTSQSDASAATGSSWTGTRRRIASSCPFEQNIWFKERWRLTLVIVVTNLSLVLIP